MASTEDGEGVRASAHGRMRTFERQFLGRRVTFEFMMTPEPICIACQRHQSTDCSTRRLAAHFARANSGDTDRTLLDLLDSMRNLR